MRSEPALEQQAASPSASTPGASATGSPGAGAGWVGQPVGQILLGRGALTPEQLEAAVALQRERPRPLGELLTELGYVDQAAVRAALMAQAGIEPVALADRKLDPEAVTCLPAEVAMRHRVLPFELQNRTLRLAMADPFDRAALEDVRVLSGRRVERHYCPEAELLEATRKAYGSKVARMIADMGGAAGPGAPGSGVEVVTSELELQELAREPSVVNLVNLIVLEAMEAQASDVHVEPFDKKLKVKYRIDGVLHEMPPPPPHLYAAIVSRIKIMSGMNIAERFVPQDGHIAFASPRGKADIRVATVPTVFGESVAMRILDRAAALIDLHGLGMPKRYLEPFGRMLARPHGIVLVTGPTGSGKTTTLYASLNRIYSPEKKIITIEDPVEFQLDGVNQIPVNRKRGVDFAGGLRAILRQDPDVIMVGEIRDKETAEIAIRSALTGHMVFSTLHTNDAAGAVTRLLDMGVEPFLLASSLEGVLAQRLVRRICEHCKEPTRPEPEVLRRMGGQAEGVSEFYRGRGCTRCRHTGYAGRSGIFELLRMTPAVRKVVLRGASAAEILAAAPSDHEPMRHDGFRRAAAGETTLEEVLRVTQDAHAQEDMG